MRYCRYNGFGLSSDLTRPLDQSVMLLYRQELIKISYNPAQFGGQRRYDSEGIMILVCYVIL